MHFERVNQLANVTPIDVLCAAWGSTPEYAHLRKASVHSMTVQEAGELAAIHGMTLPDILGV
jgi:hypothetical protein